MLALDGQTLANLEVLENGAGGSEGTLLRHLDHCRHPPTLRRGQNPPPPPAPSAVGPAGPSTVFVAMKGVR